MSYLLNELTKFITPENIEYVHNTGNVRSKFIVTRFGDIDFREKDFVGTNINLSTIFNSIFNRDLNLHNDDVLTDKGRYALEIMSGCADIGTLPVSYIYDLPVWKQGGIEHLHLKDRGHTTFILSHLNEKIPISVWKRIVKKLEENNCRGSDMLFTIKETITDQIKRGAVKEFSIVDITTKEMRDNLNNIEIALKVSIENLANHKVEIINTNNSQNPWSTHMFGQISLQSLLAKEKEPVLDIDQLYNTVKNLNVFLAKRTFLSGFKSTISKHYAHEDELLFFHLGCRLLQEDTNPEDKNTRYKLFENTENVEKRIEMFELIYTNNITTHYLKDLAKMWDKVADSPRWDSLVKHLNTIVEDIENIGHPGSTKNIVDISPRAPRAAIRFFDMILDLKSELNWGSDIGSLTNELILTTIKLLQYPKDSDPLENTIINNLKEHKTGRSSREKFFYEVLHKAMIDKYKKNTRGARESKEKKLLTLRSHLTEHNFNKRTFEVIDRKRENVYTLTTVDLMSGQGLELGHKIAGAEFTDKNTFLQFPHDNRFNSAHDITNGYWIEYGTWVQEMQAQYPYVDEDAFEDTLKFCEIMADNLI